MESKSVTAESFVRAESDMYFGRAVKDGGLGRFLHHRQLASIDRQAVIRMNRDTLYSAGVFDLDAGTLTITLPDAGERFRSLQVVTQDHYTPLVAYAAGSYTLTREQAGTRYVLVAIRTLVDPASPQDVRQAHELQDAVTVEQAGPGSFEVPKWDPASQKAVRAALLQLQSTLPDFSRGFGTKAEVDPVRHLLAAAAAWGGNPDKEASYLNVTPAMNDGATIHRLVVRDVPVDGFWSISVYNARGYFEKNAQDIYTLNNTTATKQPDGSIVVQFGGCDGNTPNCLPIVQGWNYMVRLYRPRAQFLDGSWKFPEACPAS